MTNLDHAPCAATLALAPAPASVPDKGFAGIPNSSKAVLSDSDFAVRGAIGVIGGVGPYAGLDLMRKIFDLTKASCDQDHLPVIAFSLPGEIVDRTRFLLGEEAVNPGEALGEIMLRLCAAGATVIGIPCNTAHSPRILESALRRLAVADSPARFVHMIDACVAHVAAVLKAGPGQPAAQAGEKPCVGVLSTKGTYAAGIYQDALSRAGFTPLFPDKAGRDRVQEAISGADFGIKAQSNPVRPEARRVLEEEAKKLVAQGARAVILGCTEIPLALTETCLCGSPLVDATAALARALILAYAPEKVKNPQ